jgi:hypothetical protein
MQIVRGHFVNYERFITFIKKINMAQVDNLRNGLIEKLLTISNIDYLKALNELVSSSKLEKNKLDLTEEQVLMLKLSDKDIKHGRLISQNQLDKEDLLWLKGL